MSDSPLHHPWMELALQEARAAAAEGEVPVGAVIVRGDQLLASAHNHREGWQDPTAHAELIAIQAASKALGSWRLEGCDLYVTLEPCAMCAGAMVLARVGRCLYGATDPKGGYLGTLGDLSKIAELNHRFEVISGVEADASAELLQQFFRELRARRKLANQTK